MDKLPQDATSSTMGTIYQFYNALKWCFDLVEGQTLYIERYGDVAIVGDKNIEIKAYDDSLTDSHENLWKTLSNWLNDAFDHSAYNNLLLVTTQNIGKLSKLHDWNAQSPASKLEILKEIHSKAIERYEKRRPPESGGANKTNERPKSLIIMDYVISKEAKLLESVLPKFEILDSSPLPETEYKQIVQKNAKHVLERYAESLINSLLGFVLTPKIIIGAGWAIKYEDFKNELQNLTTGFASSTRTFPPKNSNVSPNQSADDSAFVKKILQIDYKAVVDEAKKDYLYAASTILEEFNQGILESRCNNFRSEVLSEFNSKYRTACRNIANEIKHSSRDFYDACMQAQCPTFSGYESPPKSFKNGVLHLEMDDATKEMKWHLEKEGA